MSQTAVLMHYPDKLYRTVLAKMVSVFFSYRSGTMCLFCKYRLAFQGLYLANSIILLVSSGFAPAQTTGF